MHMIYWDHYYNAVLLINLLIVVGLFTALRLFSGTIAHINASDELLKKDNPAFGISLAGAAFAITLMLSGLIYGRPEDDLVYSAITIGMVGILGIILMALTRVIFAKVILPNISLRDEIMKGNKAVAIADAGNVLAIAIIIHVIMIWVTVYSLNGVLALLGGYIVSQSLMTGMTLLNIKMLGNNLQDELKNGNSALALRFAGQKIGTAFAIAMAARIVLYEEFNIVPILITWFFTSIIIILIWKVLCFIAKNIILFKVDTYQEVFEQRNIAVGALEAVIYISIGLLISRV